MSGTRDSHSVVQLMGGRFRSLLPSDLFKAGACARESLPAPRGPDYASQISKEELKRIFRRWVGCHAPCQGAQKDCALGHAGMLSVTHIEYTAC